jgi:hypothetical protein
MGFLKTKLNDIENQKVIDQRVHTWLGWQRKGDACTKEFFVVVQEKSKKFIVTKLHVIKAKWLERGKIWIRIEQNFIQTLWKRWFVKKNY